jgi:hypothetical protein
MQIGNRCRSYDASRFGPRFGGAGLHRRKANLRKAFAVLATANRGAAMAHGTAVANHATSR